MENTEITRLRSYIDKVDSDLMRLLDERAEIVKNIGEVKKYAGLPVFNGSREAEILSKTQGYRNQDYISAIFRSIFEESKKLQESQSFSHNS